MLAAIGKFLRGLGRPAPATDSQADGKGAGLLVFQHTGEVIRAESVLGKAGLSATVKAPPPQLRTGCDMVVVFDLVQEPVARAALAAAGLVPTQVVPVSPGGNGDLLEPVSLCQTRDLGDWYMVRAANMKICVAWADGVIVNVSGGGCPDVPWLASLLVGQSIAEVLEPRVNGKTLCSYALQRAFEEARQIWQQGRDCFCAGNGQKAGSENAIAEREAGLDQNQIQPVSNGADGGRAASAQASALNLSDLRPNLRQTGRPGNWLIAGTIPDEGFPLCRARWSLKGDKLVCQEMTWPGGSGPAGDGGHDLAKNKLSADDLPELPVVRGTPTLVAAALAVHDFFGLDAPQVILAGDTGNGNGSRALYAELGRSFAQAPGLPDGITFHYLFPDLDWHDRLLLALDAAVGEGERPLLIADAGFMYVAKMSGQAASYDLFTPDVGELAFLADELAPHPFYTRGFLLARDEDIPGLAERAYAGENAARLLLVKGQTDHLYRAGQELARIGEPCVPELEPVGGTGDIVAGLATGLVACGLGLEQAAQVAARAARLAGQLARPDPATQVARILPCLPEAIGHALASLNTLKRSGD